MKILRLEKELRTAKKQLATRVQHRLHLRKHKTKPSSKTASSPFKRRAIQEQRLRPFKDVDSVTFSANAVDIHYTPPPYDRIPFLRHNLHTVLFNPGSVVRYKDERSGWRNFSKHIEVLPKPEDMDMKRLAVYTPPSQDPDLVRAPKLFCFYD
jgi:hypothetical protein